MFFVSFCVALCLFLLPMIGGADEISLFDLAGESDFVFMGTPAEEIPWDIEPGVPNNPHGGYQTTSSKCITCHSTHGAAGTDISGDGANMFLGRSSSGCAYCHILGAPAAPNGTPSGGPLPSNADFWVYTNVGYSADGSQYGGDLNARSGHLLGAKAEVPASTMEGGFILGCSTCHVVHGSAVGAWLPTDLYDPSGTAEWATSNVGYKFLRSNPSGSQRDPSDPANVAVPNDIGEATALYQDIDALNQFTLSVWCANCHDAAFNAQRVPYHDMSADYSLVETFTVTGLPLKNIHPSTDPQDKESISDDHYYGFSHRSPKPSYNPSQNTEMFYTGSMECYSCHRGGLSSRGEALVGAPLPPGYESALKPGAQDWQIDVDPKAQCARCHYGFANYAVDKVRLTTGDFPHSFNGARGHLGNFMIADSADPYGEATQQNPIDELSNNPYNVINLSSKQQWAPPNQVVTITSDNVFREGFCGRCHVVDEFIDGIEGNQIRFIKSYHWLQHSMPSYWMFTPLMDPGVWHSPGVTP
ncbi:MAG: hypothetical protein FWD41_00155 [Actinomycetia bacterium]|nr:hypothetical protein [Actinomycetes bacterium]